MAGDSAETKARILEAATIEFAAHGLAGARVDRLAQRAGCNKQLIYAYFGNKEQLFDTTIAHATAELAGVVEFDPTDLAGYARGLYDFMTARPELARLVRWHALERPGVAGRLPELVARTTSQIDELATAQRQGAVDDTIPAALLLVFAIALVQTGDDEALINRGRPIASSLKRDALTTAIERLTGSTEAVRVREESHVSPQARRRAARSAAAGQRGGVAVTR